ncbi:unnamed protein product [Adineta steineri]|uniref:Uncharacterized protein n=1 Tax=Adineta steineri TaxID=433720 RepID=A0A814WR27_9BILA|nr:unnamed protein product [Adineta steineri]
MTQCLVSSTTLSITSLSTDIYPLIVPLRPDWSPHNTHLRQLTGGINNVAFGLFNNLDQLDALVIKIFGLHTEVFIDRNVERSGDKYLLKETWHVDKLEFKANNQPNRYQFYDRSLRRVPTPSEQALLDYKKELEERRARDSMVLSSTPAPV